MRFRRSEVLLVLGEQRPRQHVAQQEHDPEHLVGLDAARDDPLGELAGVGLQVLDAAGLQRVHVVVVDLGRLGEDLLVGHDPSSSASLMRCAHSSRSSVRFSRRYATSSCSSSLVARGLGSSAVGGALVAPGPWAAPRSMSPLPESSTSWAAGAGSVDEEAGDRRCHVLPAQRRGRREHADDQADAATRSGGHS